MLSLLFILACGDETKTAEVEETTTETPVKSEESKGSEEQEVDPIPSKLVEKVEEIEKPSAEESTKTEQESADAEKPAIH